MNAVTALAKSDFAPALRVAVTSRALFDLEEEDRVFRECGLEAFKALQRENVDRAPAWGTAYPLVRKLVGMAAADGSPLAEVVLVSRNDPVTALRLARAIQAAALPIIRRSFTGGGPTHQYLKAWEVDLFLSAHEEDVVQALAQGIPAALVLRSPVADPTDQDGEIRIALDGDSTLFDGESDAHFRASGGDLTAFHAREKELAHEPMNPGPIAPFLRALCRLKAAGAPVRTALITARAAPADERPIRTIQAWGLEVDEIHALGGRSKAPILEAFGADLFLDDSPTVAAAGQRVVPTSLVCTPRASA